MTNKMIKIAHSADWHIRSTHMQKHSRGQDFFRAAMSVIVKAHEHGCDALVVCGDICDSKRLSSYERDCLQELHDAARSYRLPVYVIDGNHDESDPSWYLDIKPQDDCCGFIQMPIKVKKADVKGLTIQALAACSPEEFLEGTAAMDPGDILLWHGGVQEIMGYPDPAELTLDQLPTDKFRAILLGDIHTRNYVEHKGCLVGYPGATELVKKDEPLTHSFTILEFAEKQITMEEVPTDHRKAVAWRVDTEAQLGKMIGDLQAMEDEHPLVFISYYRGISNILHRIYTALDPDKFILRPAAQPKLDLPVLLGGGADKEPGKEPKDFVHKFFADGSPMANMATKLCDPEVTSNAEIVTFIQTQIGRLEKNENT